MYSAANPPLNKCKEPEHVFSEITGRCKTCHAIRQRLRRGSLRQTIRGAPRRAVVVQGAPCRVCGGTERYQSGGNCVACQRRHGRRHSPVLTEYYYIPTEFLQWIRSPAPHV